jgi:ribonuclease E
MGKISRFGLMELSRQRLRPALNEGSHVTCPRCNGVGVIRDTESSALHILRILQEEAMKEGTAAIHAQVPVEVATFLLNEKRVDIAKLEARLRVSIVLIPNKFLETPHYKVERLRHDDERLEAAKASFERAEAPATEVVYGTPQSDGERAKPKQEAVVRGILPQMPAPVVAPPPAPPPVPLIIVPAAEASLWTRVKRWITGEPATLSAPATAAAPAPATPQREARDRTGRDEKRPPRRERGARDERRDDRNRDRGRDGKREAQRDGQRDGQGEQQAQARGDGRRDERQRRDGKQRGPADTQTEGQRDTLQQARQGDGQTEETKRRDDRRRDRGPRPPKDKTPGTVDAATRGVVTGTPPAEPVAPAPVSAMVQESPAEALTETNAPAAEGQGEERRGRRRRRRRGGRNEAGAPRTGTDTEVRTDDDADETEPRQMELAEAVEAVAAPSAQPPERLAEPVVPPAPLIPEPVKVTAPSVSLERAVAAPLPLDQLLPMLESAGMTLAETNQEKYAVVQARIAAEPAAPHVPRERPILPPVDVGPLVQVETRRESTQALL